jgi:arginyl-tRNA synthetase
MLLGNAVANILNASGYTVVRTEVVNDRGIHICKSMLAYQKTAAGALPDKKSDHFVGDFYVAYSRYLAEHPEAEEEIAHMLQLREQGDPDVRALWAQMNTRALEGFAESYKRFGVDIQARYLESEHYEA